MLKRYLEEFGTTRKDFFIIFFLLFNTFSWLFMTRRIISEILEGLGATYIQSLIVWGVYDLALIGSGLVGSIFSGKVKRLTFLYLWILLGTITSLLPSFITNMTLTHALGISFFWSISLGLGVPSCLAYFGDCTVFENRGLVSGITFLITNMSAPLIVMFLRINLTTSFIISAFWRGLGLIVLFSMNPEEKNDLKRRERISFMSILQNKSFLFYLIPWLMFNLIDGFEKLIFEHLLEYDFFELLRMIGATIGTISAFVGGLLSDWVGRKRVVIYGFISLGLAYAIIGITPTMIISWYFYCVIDGIAWGIFTVTFVLVLWGDLSSSGTRERYYAVGSIPFFLAELIKLLFTPYVSIPPNAAFSVASLFLFVAVLPLMYAPETLPKRKIELRRLRKYVEAAKKVKEKYGEKRVES